MSQELFTKSNSGLLAVLRKRYPDEGWTAIRAGFGWAYRNAKGEDAWLCAALAPRYDGDDNTFRSEFWIYRNNKPAELIEELSGRIWEGE